VSIEARADLVDRHDIEVLVRDFYRQAAMDDLLGPIFAEAKVDWPTHIDTLVRFWSWQLLGEREYAGNPLRAHEPVHARTPFTHGHYERWLDLFTDTVDARFVGPNAELAKNRAAKMATAMERLLAGHSSPGDVAIEPMWSGPRRVARSES
jgi:Truncated hemoglobins